MCRVPKIQYITRDDAHLSHLEQAELMFRNGIEWVQIRMKNSSDEERVKTSAKAIKSAKKFGGKLIINDSLEIAREVGAHGIHLGLNDCSIRSAREVLGPDVIIGGTANTVDDILTQVKRGADYVGVGPFRFTETKKNLSPVIGLAGYKEIIKKLKQSGIQTPLVAVGGITINDIEKLIQLGLSGVAISGALLDEYRNK